MSWSVHAIGKAAAVAARIETQFAANKCVEPEETIRQGARLVILAALGAQTRPDALVKVVASGSQSTDGTGLCTNNLSIAIDPQYGFVE